MASDGESRVRHPKVEGERDFPPLGSSQRLCLLLMGLDEIKCEVGIKCGSMGKV